MAVVTVGADGAHLIEEDSIISLCAPQLSPDDVEQMDTTGAGDAFAAGFVLAYLQRNLRDCRSSKEKLQAKSHWIRMGVVAGTDACCHLGGSVGDPIDFREDKPEFRDDQVGDEDWRRTTSHHVNGMTGSMQRRLRSTT